MKIKINTYIYTCTFFRCHTMDLVENYRIIRRKLKKEKQQEEIEWLCHKAKNTIKQLSVESVEHCNNNSDFPSGVTEDEPLDYTVQSYIEFRYSIEKVLQHTRKYLNQNGFPGDFKQVGSFADGTKVTAKDEFDYLYELTTDICVNETSKQNSYHITDINGKPISSYDYYHSFAKTLASALEELQDILPSNLTFGGFAHKLSKSSGVRLNEPAVTLLFLTADGESTIDITPAFSLPWKQQDHFVIDIRHKLKSYLRLDRNQDYNFYGKLHLVALYPECHQWHVTSSQSECYLFGKLPCHYKAAVRAAKLLNIHTIQTDVSQLQQKISKSPTGSTIEEYIDAIIGKIDLLLSGSLPEDQAETLRHKLAKLMSFAHILIPQQRAQQYRETTTKGHIGISTTAFKYQLLNQALIDHHVDSIEYETLVADVLKSLCKGRINHSFLDYDILAVTVPYYLAFLDKKHLQSLIKQTLECCMWLSQNLQKSESTATINI